MRTLVLLLTFGTLAGCVSYQPRPLGTQSTLQTDVAHISIDRSQMPLPELVAHEFNAEGGLGMTDIAMMRASRTRRRSAPACCPTRSSISGSTSHTTRSGQ